MPCQSLRTSGKARLGAHAAGASRDGALLQRLIFPHYRKITNGLRRDETYGGWVDTGGNAAIFKAFAAVAVSENKLELSISAGYSND